MNVSGVWLAMSDGGIIVMRGTLDEENDDDENPARSLLLMLAVTAANLRRTRAGAGGGERSRIIGAIDPVACDV